MFESHPDITIKRVGPEDRDALVLLAGRDSSNVPTGTLIAAVASGGAMLAAVSIETGELVADPFLPSAHAAGLLRVRARQLRGEHAAAGSSRRRRRRTRGALPASPPGAGGRLLTLSGMRPPS